MVFAFDGVAHPPPPRDGRKSHPADMCAGQIATTNLGRNNGTPLLVEHDRSAPPVGKVLASWEGRNGELRVTGIVDDHGLAGVDPQHAVRLGRERVLDDHRLPRVVPSPPVLHDPRVRRQDDS